MEQKISPWSIIGWIIIGFIVIRFLVWSAQIIWVIITEHTALFITLGICLIIIGGITYFITSNYVGD